MKISIFPCKYHQNSWDFPWPCVKFTGVSVYSPWSLTYPKNPGRPPEISWGWEEGSLKKTTLSGKGLDRILRDTLDLPLPPQQMASESVLFGIPYLKISSNLATPGDFLLGWGVDPNHEVQQFGLQKQHKQHLKNGRFTTFWILARPAKI